MNGTFLVAEVRKFITVRRNGEIFRTQRRKGAKKTLETRQRFAPLRLCVRNDSQHRYSQNRYLTPSSTLTSVRNTNGPVLRTTGSCTLPSTTNRGRAAYCSPGAR